MACGPELWVRTSFTRLCLVLICTDFVGRAVVATVTAVLMGDEDDDDEVVDEPEEDGGFKQLFFTSSDEGGVGEAADEEDACVGRFRAMILGGFRREMPALLPESPIVERGIWNPIGISTR